MQPNFAEWQRPSNTLRGWSKYAYFRSKMADGRHFEKKSKNRQLNNRGTTGSWNCEF